MTVFAHIDHAAGAAEVGMATIPLYSERPIRDESPNPKWVILNRNGPFA
jgi:hypothetical protein